VIFSIDVTLSTHSLLRRGVTEGRIPGSRHHHHRVVVEAPDLTEALLTAAQMAATVFGHAMVTGTYWRF
jgi:hypothetical protein